MLKLYNSITQTKKVFTSLRDKSIFLYVCGMTVYDYCHIGHGRVFVVYDTFVRYLRSQGYQVNYVRNITDIDDKIIKRAQESHKNWETLTAQFIEAMHEDEKVLGCESPDKEPRATDYIPKMIELIEHLIDLDFAYINKNGDVCYEVRKFEGYGKLSHRDVDHLRTGIRIEINDAKRDPLDFVLWKLSKPGEPTWPSPWGEGRPGWHIECSAMSSDLLGQPFDIHGGGVDLKFPHHENEIAQSEAAYQKNLVNYWMHVGHVQVEREKMSKSLGNFLTIREAVKQYHPEAVRYFMLSGHYRSPINFSADNMMLAQQALTRLYLALRHLPKTENKERTQFDDQFESAMNDDFNTPEVLAVLFNMAREVNRYREEGNLTAASELGTKLKKFSHILGLLLQDPEVFLQGQAPDEDVKKIEELVKEREQARRDKNWKKADDIRSQLDQMGILIEDGAQGGTWRRKN